MKKIAKCSENSGLQRKYHYPPYTRGSTRAQPLVMGTGNPGVFPERPRPVPLNTLTLSAGRGISRVQVRVWQGFEGLRVERRVTHNLGIQSLIMSYIIPT